MSGYSLAQIQQRMEEYYRNKPTIIDIWGSAKIYDHIIKQVCDFERTLDREHELGILLQLSGMWYNIVITEIVVLPPTLIMFKGVLKNSEGNEEDVRVIQHINQVNLLLRKVKRPNPEEPKRTIGFVFKEE
jgi:hypothetical protein